MTFKDPFQPKPFCDSIILWHWTFFPCAWRVQGNRCRTAFLVLSPVPKKERQMGLFALLSFSIRWRLGAQPMPLACWWAQFTVLRGRFPRYPCGECWGQGEPSYASYWVVVLAPVPAENQWKSAAQEPVCMWPSRDPGNPATKLTAVRALQFRHSTVLKSTETASVPSCPFLCQVI